ncbi:MULTISPECIES: energy transducer TonB [unclassified Aureispira]|uniref:energy transducer TonB n=1 Tax=unclassified Aureispira TaxID=2649989 RepID=UPI000696FFA4|nr:MULTISPECIES: energy transducer TonB [unclassified Aureispira]WMX13293.1 TonB family protein [Aureispira sp. CCB-E]
MKQLMALIALSILVVNCNSTQKATKTTAEKNPYENAYDDFLEPTETKVYAWYLGINSVRGEEAYIVRSIYPEKRQITSLSTYKYEDRDVLHGSYMSWSDDGLKTSEGNYKNNYKEGIWKFYSYGKLYSEGIYTKGEKQGLWKYYYQNGKVESELYWKDDLREGAFVEYDTLGMVVNEGMYKADSIIQQTLEVEEAELSENDVIVDEMPRFPGCEAEEGDHKAKKKCADQKLLKFIYSNIQYPSFARENAAEGMVVISFTVMEDGRIVDVRAIRGICEPLEKECLRLVRLMPQWIPGRQNGKEVRVKYNLPVRFKLN